MDEPFDAWMVRVDSLLEKVVGCTSSDLPDCCYADWHDSGLSPEEVVNEVIENAF